MTSSQPIYHQRRAKSKVPELERRHYSGFVRYLEHGYPSPLVRWHCHEEYELHLIVATSGKVFVGDYIGHFTPGQLVLTGPRLPHNWISNATHKTSVRLRDMLVQFAHQPLEAAARNVPELHEVMALLARAAYGIEFFGMSREAEVHLGRVRDTSGVTRLSEFLALMGKLARCREYRLLSSVHMKSFNYETSLAQIDTILNHIAENYRHRLSAELLARKAGMSMSKFSRFFRRSTGRSFTGFVNHLRINMACQLLMNTNQYVNNVCYDVGFNNLANFNRHFLRLKGVTPKEFRRKAEGRFGAQVKLSEVA